jgi:outer membrane receptor protein involved in Fe transport
MMQVKRALFARVEWARSAAGTSPAATGRSLTALVVRISGLFGCFGLPAYAVPMDAETESADTLGEIVVTAQRREQSIQDVGVSVTALGSDDLRLLNITDTLKLGATIPGLQLNSSSGGSFVSLLTIRGVAQNDYSPHQESPNSMYIDDVYVSAPNAMGAQMFDVQRVETLRGPQGTLFGRNSTGGLINFITNEPTKDTEGYLSVTGAEFNEVRLEGALGGAITDSIRGRFAFLSWDLGGATLTSISNFTDLHVNYDESCAAAPQDTCHDPYKQDLKQWSQEVRINGASGPLTWVTGIYGLGTYQHNFAAFYEPYYAGTDFAFNAFNRLAQKLVSESAFGQVEYSFTPGWRGVLGLRETHDQKEFQSRTYYNELGSFVPGRVFPMASSSAGIHAAFNLPCRSRAAGATRSRREQLWRSHIRGTWHGY